MKVASDIEIDELDLLEDDPGDSGGDVDVSTMIRQVIDEVPAGMYVHVDTFQYNGQCTAKKWMIADPKVMVSLDSTS
jgi:hypothetical protein